ncbi:MAG: 6-hydroxymethylpterin diphosphokinase MptE-like protein [Promethearchaeota archaeon]
MAPTLKNQIDFYKDFKELYSVIKDDFKFDYKKEKKARALLSDILSCKSDKWDIEYVLDSFRNHLHQKKFIYIYGCGPSLEDTVNKLVKDNGKTIFENVFNLAADGASLFLMEKGITIDGIFTDLDGITKDAFNYSKFIIVHAHGDNIEKILEFKQEILNVRNIIGTTQIKPVNNLINPGGFTDGDRILYFLRSLLLPHHKIFLIGMDFKGIIGKYSKPSFNSNKKASYKKLKKLKYAVKLIEWLLGRINNEIYFVNSEPVSDKFKYINIREFKEILR